MRGNGVRNPDTFVTTYRPNMWAIHEATYQTYYCYAAKIRVNYEVTRIISGSTNNAFSLRCGVTCAATNGGLGVPTLSASSNDHWGDSNLSKSRFCNFNANTDKNAVEYFLPISAI